MRTLILFSLLFALSLQAQEIRVYAWALGSETLPAIGNKNGTPTGIDADVIREVAKRNKWTIKWVPLDKMYALDHRLSMLLDKKVDIAMGAITITEERKKRVLFSDSYMKAGLGIIHRTADKVEDLNWFKGRRMLSYGPDSTPTLWVKKNLKESVVLNWGVTKEYSPEVLLKQNKVDAFVNDWPVLKVMAKQDKQLTVYKEIVQAEDWGFAVMKDRADLKESIDASLKAMRADKSLSKIIAQYLD